MRLEDKNTSSEEERIQNLLDEYNPSGLDEQVKTVCPFFRQRNRNFTSAYLDFHEYNKVGILTRLQLRLENLTVTAEEGTESGRVDGSVHRLEVEDDNVFLYEEEEIGRKILLVECKSGREIKPLQASAYAYTEGVPVVVAEVRNGCCHLIDLETAAKLLGYAGEQLGLKETLRERGQRIPDQYRCESCSDESCEHWSGGGSAPEARYVVRDRTKQLHEHLPEVVDEIVEIVEDVLSEDGFSVEVKR